MRAKQESSACIVGNYNYFNSTMNFRRFIFFAFAVCTSIVMCGYFMFHDTERRVYIIDPELDTTETTLNVSFLTIQANKGRLGNQMFTFATLYGLCKVNKREPAVMRKTYYELRRYFEFPKYPVVNTRIFVENRPWNISNWLRPIDYHIPPDTNIVKGNLYPTSYTFFDHLREEIKGLFRFRQEFVAQAQETLRRVKQFKPRTQVFVGIHVRRGDYVLQRPGGWLREYEGREVDMAFFKKATDYFRKRFTNVTFVAVSDDLPWCREHLSKLGILTVPESTGPAADLALLSLCNHTIITYGTYGFWGGYLAGGEVVYFSDFLKPNTNMTLDYYRWDKMYPEDWIPISTTPPGYWETYQNPFAL